MKDVVIKYEFTILALPLTEPSRINDIATTIYYQQN